METSKQTHWETIYQTKQPNEVSWTQVIPEMSLNLIKQLNLPKDAEIIDVGGGDSKLVDFLIDQGYTRVSVLDISQAAIDRAKIRLGEKANQVTWIVSDILDFKPNKKYHVWHDRAAFHFQTEDEQINRYLNLVQDAVSGNLIIGTFSNEGPTRCSGLPIQQYNEESMHARFAAHHFTPLPCQRDNHITPSGGSQNFVFCVFEKKY